MLPLYLLQKRSCCMLMPTLSAIASFVVVVCRVLKNAAKGNSKEVQHEVATADPAGMGSKLAAQ